MQQDFKTKIFRGAFWLSGGEIASYGASFIRNVILARILTRDDFGLVASFALTITLFEIIGKMAIDSLIVQSKKGDEPEFVATCHAFQLMGGIISAGLILLMAAPLARLFGVAEATWAFAMLAFVPLCRAFMSLDVNRLRRELIFKPSIQTEVIPHLVTLALTWPVAAWLRDYRAFLVLLVTRWFLTTLLTHYLAHRPYRLGWRRQYALAVALFGWPLIVNGLLIFLSRQADQMVVGSAYSMSDLAAYSVAASLSLIPGMMLIKVFTSLSLPVLSSLQDEPNVFLNRYRLIAQSLGLFAVVFSVVMILNGENIVRIIYGERYSGVGMLLGCLAAGQGFRIMRAAPTIAALARGDSKNLMFSNLFRATGLAFAIHFAAAGYDLMWIAVAALLAEVIAFAAAAIRLSALYELPAGLSLWPALLCALAVSGAVWAPSTFGLNVNNWISMALLTLLAIVLILAAGWPIMHSIRDMARRSVLRPRPSSAQS